MRAPRRRGPAMAPKVTRVHVETDRGVFMISVAAQLANMHPQTLRMYETRGLIEPQRSPKGTRLYSQEDVEKLRRIQEMTAELGINLAGVERVMRLEQELEQMQARIEEIELEALHTQVRLAQELEEVRRSFRAELTVPYRGGLELVRAADARSPFKPPRRP
jgi:MerR family transcriptional regulator/heat shock protein HspR